MNSYDEPQATWNKRYSTTSWSKSGGDLGESLGSISITNKVGSRITLNLTSFVQNVNRLRALEGELARTIRAINRVEFLITARLKSVQLAEPMSFNAVFRPSLQQYSIEGTH